MGGKIGVLVDVETDVVNDAVREMARNVAMQIAALKPQYTNSSEVSEEYIAHEKEILLAQIMNDPKESQKPEKVIQGMITHMGGKIGVLVDVETDVVNDAVKEMARNVAMQIAALKPQYTNSSEVSEEYIAHEKEILLAQIMNDPKESQKPEKVIQGMINGRINKELKEICLLDQVYVKAEDGKQNVAKYVEEVAKANGAKITVKGFIRFETGEGIEKKQEDFAAEVAAQMGN